MNILTTIQEALGRGQSVANHPDEIALLAEMIPEAGHPGITRHDVATNLIASDWMERRDRYHRVSGRFQMSAASLGIVLFSNMLFLLVR